MTGRSSKVIDVEQIEALERQYWLAGPEFYRENLAAKAVMLFQEPVGRLNRAEIISSVDSAPRWSRVALIDTQITPIADDAVLITYQARGSRAGEEDDYRAHAATVYVQVDSTWRLAFHQQTPITEQ